MQRVLDFLRTDDLPPLARGNYAAELRQMLLWGVVVGAVESSIASVVASKTFDAPELLTSVVFAIPILVNVLNVLWSVVIRGRRRVRVFVTLAACALIALCSIGLTPAAWQPWGAYAFAAQVALTHLFISGLITLRTTMWKVNYAQSHRARIAGRLQTLRMLLSLLTTALLSVLFDRNPEYYRFIYPLVALIGLASLWPASRIRMRGEKAELRHFRAHVARNHRSEDGRVSLWAGVRESVSILYNDRVFAKYMLAQFLLGSANFFTDPVLVNVLAKRLDFSYFGSTLLLFQIPIVVLLISIRFWARFFDRVGILRFRIHNSACWVGSYFFVTIATALLGMGGEAAVLAGIVVLVAGRIMNGLGRGGGAIAWNLGHLHFAREHQTELYMGIHVALTGLRGLLMPLLGWVANYYLGWGSFAIAMALALTAHVLFRRMAAADRQPPVECAPDREEPSGPRADVT